ncbi:DNA endonuclease SmrA [Pantoea sp. 1.19]|uniref:DNA endonuclease SmrA n=1 Tax=Pantoea sp. 1.19 TaxID=1925589 RepID=UPI000948C73A|nr:DNA endonuclease SmrA [Pantoea sp. 1.19]
MSLDDDEMFRDAMGDVTPLKKRDSVHWQPARQGKIHAVPAEAAAENPLSLGFLDIVALGEPLEYKADGIQQGVLDKLRQGKYRLDASLNLTRQPVAACREALYRFILNAHQHNQRNLLIIHGKGREDTSHANVVRSYVARWMRELAVVQACCEAQRQHGGSGACYVALSKNAGARLENWERHARRGR